MEPKLPLPDRGPESRPATGIDHGEALLPPSDSEIGSRPSMEYIEYQNETATSAENTHIPAITLPIPTTQSLQDDATGATLPIVPDDTPATANDYELIEKEWIVKVKKVVAETKDDPYQLELEVTKIQKDYQYKRYGRVPGSPRQ